MNVNWIALAIKWAVLRYTSCGLPTMTFRVRTDLQGDLLISRAMYNGPLQWEVQMSRRRQMVPITMAINEDANSSAIAGNFNLWFDTFLSASHCCPLSVLLLFALLFRVTQRIATSRSDFLALVFVLARSCDAASSLRSAPYPATIFLHCILPSCLPFACTVSLFIDGCIFTWRSFYWLISRHQCRLMQITLSPCLQLLASKWTSSISWQFAELH